MAFFFFLPLLSLLLLPNAGHAKFIQKCDKNFTNNEILQSSINNALLDMVAESSVYRYAASRYGGDYDAVYGLTWCRGDVSTRACSACIVAAAQSVRSTCPDSAESSIWFYDDLCFLRYDTSNFLGEPDANYAGRWMSTELAGNPGAFDQAVGELMGEVTAYAGSSAAKFGWGENREEKENFTIQGMAQCTRDLSQPACYRCLEKALETVSTNCRYHLGCHVISTSCVLRYEIYPFLVFSPPTPRYPSNSRYPLNHEPAL